MLNAIKINPYSFCFVYDMFMVIAAELIHFSVFLLHWIILYRIRRLIYDMLKLYSASTNRAERSTTSHLCIPTLDNAVLVVLVVLCTLFIATWHIKLVQEGRGTVHSRGHLLLRSLCKSFIGTCAGEKGHISLIYIYIYICLCHCYYSHAG